jgi:glutaredoxin
MITLYQAEWCEYCHRVRQTLTELGLTYTAVNVPFDRSARR